MFTQRRPPTQEEMEHMAFYDHPGYIHPGIRCVDIYRYTYIISTNYLDILFCHISRTSDPTRNKRQYYVFYQWVCFVIFIQVS